MAFSGSLIVVVTLLPRVTFLDTFCFPEGPPFSNQIGCYGNKSFSEFRGLS